MTESNTLEAYALRVNLGYHVDNNLVIWDNEVQPKKITNQTSTVARQNDFKAMLQQVQSKDDPESALLKPNRFNRFLNGNLHVLIDYDFNKLPKISVQDNCLSVPIDRPFSVGEFNGKPTAVRIFTYGGMESCLSMGCSLTPEESRTGALVPLMVRVMDKYPDTYTPSEQKEIRKKSLTVYFLTNLSRGKLDYEVFKDLVSRERLDLKKELQALGFDLSKEFTVNGKKFLFKDNNLSLVE